ncbi:MAG: KamA family protein [Bacteroidaceae bacterium]|nr:KamA family protein [Bacteroidaceae bacterium]
MKQNQLLSFTLMQLENAYEKNFPEIKQMADEATDFQHFYSIFSNWLNIIPAGKAKVVFEKLLENEGKTIHEWSRNEDITLCTIEQLYKFLRHEADPSAGTDLYIDLFMQLYQLAGKTADLPSEKKIRHLTERWSSGLDEEVIAIRKENRERMLHLLVEKIEHAHSQRFHFEYNMTYEEKYQQVSQWWYDERFQLRMALKTPTEINLFMGKTLSAETMFLMRSARKKGIPFFVTPYYLSLIDPERRFDDTSIRSYIFYSPELVKNFGNIKAWEREDVVVPGQPNAAGWMVPEGENVHRRYPEVAILIPDTMGRACGGLCASCQRMYGFQSKRLNFDLTELLPHDSWPKKLQRLMQYFEHDPLLRDILITGGDALMSRNKTLKNILEAVFQMAARKHKANSLRPEGKKFAELQRVRLGTRLPAYLPMRIDDELVEILRDFREKASTVGVRQFIIQTHFQSPLEVTPEAEKAVKKLLSAGWIVDNQQVFNVASSRRGHSMKLREVLSQIGMVGYYTFTVKGFEENSAVFAPNARSAQESEEEKKFAVLSATEADTLATSLTSAPDPGAVLRRYLRTQKRSVVATDRNVLNLPAIGKSMTFQLIGFAPDGRRILQFDHDPNRLHSPVIHRIGKVNILENRSIASYLRQLVTMGEDPKDYATIWYYTESQTEPRFPLYRYPDFHFNMDSFENLLSASAYANPKTD